MRHLRCMIGRISLSVAYGIELSPGNDPNMAHADAALAGFGMAQTKGRIFNLVPFFMRLPWWFPGAGFKKDADMWKRKMDLCRDEPYEAVKRALPTPEEILMTKALPSNVYLGKSFWFICSVNVLRLHGTLSGPRLPFNRCTCYGALPRSSTTCSRGDRLC
ncbi:hypothetical protein B0F90DRAFT_1697013, partial [Multifurca ochricompacta]